MEISQGLYSLLLIEHERINKLLNLVKLQRGSALLSVLSWEIVSEQIEEILIEEKWMSKDMITAIRDLIISPNNKEDYKWNINEYDAKKKLQTIMRILNRWQDIPKRLDAFEKKPKWSIAAYEIMKDYYPNELFKDIGAKNDDEVQQNFANITMNIPQIDWLHKNEKLDKEPTYIIFVTIDQKIMLLYIALSNENKFYRKKYSDVWHISKGTRMLLFTPLDLQR